MILYIQVRVTLKWTGWTTQGTTPATTQTTSSWPQTKGKKNKCKSPGPEICESHPADLRSSSPISAAAGRIYQFRPLRVWRNDVKSDEKRGFLEEPGCIECTVHSIQPELKTEGGYSADIYLQGYMYVRTISFFGFQLSKSSIRIQESINVERLNSTSEE